jgi:uncharacterized membrane protein
MVGNLWGIWWATLALGLLVAFGGTFVHFIGVTAMFTGVPFTRARMDGKRASGQTVSRRVSGQRFRRNNRYPV